jgi:dihydroorotase
MIAVHAEEESVVQRNLAACKAKYGEDIPVQEHPNIRSEEACYLSSLKAVTLAKKHGSRLHLLHLSTASEMDLLTEKGNLKDKKITGEVCVHHLWFDEKDYDRLGSKIKWNPSIKKEKDKLELLAAVLDNRIDIIATDHAPHLLEEKANPYTSCPSGAPLIQHSFVIMLEMYHQKKISLEKIVDKMCHSPSILYRINKRGFIREGYHADLVLVDLKSPWKVKSSNILYKCGWSPVEGETFSSQVTHTFVNGTLVYENGKFFEGKRGSRLEFDN